MNGDNVMLFVHILSVDVLFAALTFDSTVALGMQRSRSVERAGAYAAYPSSVDVTS